jgi:hypothetical protein
MSRDHMPTPNLTLLVTPATNVYARTPALSDAQAASVIFVAFALLALGVLLVEGRALRALSTNLNRLVQNLLVGGRAPGVRFERPLW